MLKGVPLAYRYDRNNLYLLFFHNDKINKYVVALDDSEDADDRYRPYFYVDAGDNFDICSDKILQVENVEMLDIYRKKRMLKKIVCYKPSDVPEVSSLYSQHYPVYENKILFVYRYCGDRKIHFCCDNSIERKGAFVNVLVAKIEEDIPNMKYISVDIEVETDGVLPNIEEANNKIVSIALYAPNMIKVLVLANIYIESSKDFPDWLEVYGDERMLISRFFEYIKDYHVIITYNGQQFDIPYLYNRCKRLGLEQNVINSAYQFADHVHLDVYKLYSHHVIKFNVLKKGNYSNSLSVVAKLFLNEEKIERPEKIVVPQDTNSTIALASYNVRDAELTYRLATFDEMKMVKVLFTVARIANISIEDVLDFSIAKWTFYFVFSAFSSVGVLLPNKQEIAKDDITDYEGAIVLNPVPGIHKNICVLDFSSLYPTCIINNNLSFDTIDCQHDDCRTVSIDDKFAERKTFRICTKYKGVLSILLKHIRDLRINKYKPLYKQQKTGLLMAILDILRIFMNASYGVFSDEDSMLGAKKFGALVTYFGRKALSGLINEYERLSNKKVLYGDTDSVFFEYDKDIVEKLCEYAKHNDFDLELKGIYDFCVLSKAKKNYLLVFDRNVEIKGLAGKKNNVPDCMRKFYSALIEQLVECLYNFVHENIFDVFVANYKAFKTYLRDCDVKELCFVETLNTEPDSNNQHSVIIKVVSEYEKIGKSVKVGEKVSYCICKNGKYLPYELAKKELIDYKRYEERYLAIVSQIAKVFDITKEQIQMCSEGQHTLV